MRRWKDLTKLYKVMSYKHRKNWASRPSKWFRKKEEKKSKEETKKYTECSNTPYKEEIIVRMLRRKPGQNVRSIRTPEIVMNRHSNAVKKIKRVCTERSNGTMWRNLRFECWIRRMEELVVLWFERFCATFQRADDWKFKIGLMVRTPILAFQRTKAWKSD